jgi:hypothetical protein
MRYFPQELLIMRLAGTLPEEARLDEYRRLTTDECVAQLKAYSGKDFGHDAEAWSAWFATEKVRWEREAVENEAELRIDQSSEKRRLVDAKTLAELLRSHTKGARDGTS